MNKTAIEQYIKDTYPAQYKLVVEGGKLVDGWSNVAEHCFVQAAVTESLCELLKVDAGTTDRLVRVAACHDWDKRLEKKPNDFSEEEKQLAARLFAEAEVEIALLRATGPMFLLRVKNNENEVDPLELIQFYIDDITLYQVVLFDERIDDVEARNPRPDCSEMTADELEQGLGCRYWEAEREFGHKVEKAICDVCGMEPGELVSYLNDKLERRFPSQA